MRTVTSVLLDELGGSCPDGRDSSLEELLAEFSSLLPGLVDAPVLVQVDNRGVAHCGRCLDTTLSRPASPLSSGARFGQRAVREVIALEGCCRTCVPPAIAGGGGTARMFESQLADLRHGLAAPAGSRRRALHLSRLLLRGRNRALYDFTFTELRDRVLRPEIDAYQHALPSLPYGDVATDGLLLVSAGDVHETSWTASTPVDLESEIVCSVADRLQYCSPGGGLLVLRGRERIASHPRRQRYGTPVLLPAGFADDQASVLSLLEISGSFCDDALSGATTWEPLGSWWETAALLASS